MRESESVEQRQRGARRPETSHRRAGGGNESPALSNLKPEGSPGTGEGGNAKSALGSTPWRKLLVGCGAALIFAIGAGQLVGSGGDSVSPSEIELRAAEFAASTAVRFSYVPDSELESAAAELRLPAEEAEAVVADVQSGATRLVYFTLWDTHDQDGDSVVVTSNGISQTIQLKNAQQTIPIPEPHSGFVTVKGVDDGGGGITVGVLSGGQPVNLPVLEPGQQVAIPSVVGW